ncbi:MAG: methyl-accepting chemotaxis protein, partial [Nitrospirota bacterium]
AKIGLATNLFNRVRVNVDMVILADNADRARTAVARMEELESKMNALLADFDKTADIDDDRKEVNLIKAGLDKYEPVMAEVVKLATRGKRNEAVLLMDRYKPLATEINDIFNGFTDMQTSSAKAINAENIRRATTAQAAIVALMILGTLANICLGTYIAGLISGPLKRGVDFAAALAEGDLTKRIDIERKDEVGRLASALNEMAESLGGTMKKIMDSASHVESSSSQLSVTSEHVAKGAADQDSQASQVAAAIEEMSASVMEVARNSAEAAGAAKEAAASAKNGGEIVVKTIERIEKIAKTTMETTRNIDALGQSSDKIGEIVSVINDIADQTNLLALNAAIEAARAGEQGRGFAVVADEVRKLAERTTKATKEIAGMIKSIQDDTKIAVSAMDEGSREVEEGVSLAREAGNSLEKIMERVNKVTEMVQRIAAASEQQSTASEDISVSVENIAGVIKQNAGAAQETSKAAQEITGLGRELEGLVSRFRINATEPSPAAKEKEPAGRVIDGMARFRRAA